MKTGWLTLNGKKYYFTSSGVMLVSTTTSVDGKTYKFDSNGVATETTPIYQESGNYVKVYDAEKREILLYGKTVFTASRELQMELCQIWTFSRQYVMLRQVTRD